MLTSTHVEPVAQALERIAGRLVRDLSVDVHTLGIPHKPNPPTASEAPDGTSPTASAALATSLSTAAPFRPSSPAGAL
jgi:hypothetical protein